MANLFQTDSTCASLDSVTLSCQKVRSDSGWNIVPATRSYKMDIKWRTKASGIHDHIGSGGTIHVYVVQIERQKF